MSLPRMDVDRVGV